MYFQGNKQKVWRNWNSTDGLGGYLVIQPDTRGMDAETVISVDT